MKFSRNLKRGMAGDDIKAVKDRLVELKYLHASTHGTFGTDTLKAVKAFQTASGLEADGIVGKLTWAALFGTAVPEASAEVAAPTIITASNKAEAICAAAYKYVGMPYVWGASGTENPSDSFIKGKNQTVADAQRSIKFRNKLQSGGVTWMRCFDCSGFISFLLREIGAWDARRDCDGIWNICKQVSKAELVRGDFCFRNSSSDTNDETHIGLYLGNGWVIHAKGRDVGVVVEGINTDGSGYWHKFGRCNLLY